METLTKDKQKIDTLTICPLVIYNKELKKRLREEIEREKIKLGIVIKEKQKIEDNVNIIKSEIEHINKIVFERLNTPSMLIEMAGILVKYPIIKFNIPIENKSLTKSITGEIIDYYHYKGYPGRLYIDIDRKIWELHFRVSELT